MATMPCIKCPVTAIQITENLILSGYGSKLVVYQLSDNSKLGACKIFASNRRIYKLIECASDPGLWLILGGKHARCIRLQCGVENKSKNELISSSGDNGVGCNITFASEEMEFLDWIWDGCWINADTIVLATAHNTVLCWQPFYPRSTVSKTINIGSSCLQQCILYSATFGKVQDEIILAVGTVFNKVLLWKPDVNITQHNYKPVTQTFSGHEGVIFRIRFHKDEKQMLSVSDDRSIRLWSIADGSCLHVFYGHVARVWDAQFTLPDENITNENIVSIGEDAVCIVWTCIGNIVKKYSGHKGKSIWSLHADQGLIVTGGGDGAIRKWKISEEQIEVNTQPIELVLPAVNEQDKKTDYPRVVRFIESRILLLLSNEGLLWRYEVDSGAWTMLHKDHRFYSYSCFSSISHLIALGSLDGIIKVVNINNVACIGELSLFTGKVLSMFLIDVGKQRTLFACGPDGEIKVLAIQEHKEEVSFELLCMFTCPDSKQRWIAAVDVVTPGKNVLHIDNDPPEIISDHEVEPYCLSDVLKNVVFICGDRRGSVHVFNPLFKDPVQSILGVHGKTGVTQIQVHGGFIYSTGRDGSFRKYQYNFEDQALVSLDKQKACKGMDWIEGIWFIHTNNSPNRELVVYGFYMQNHFAAWNYDTNELLFKIRCGGGYRSWDVLFPNVNDNSLSFSYVKGSVLNLVSYRWKPTCNSRIIEAGLHGREVMSVKVLGKCGSMWLLATCSEDTTINFSVYNDRKSTVECLHTAVGHIGGIRDLCFVPLCRNELDAEEHVFQGYLISSGSRTSLKVWMLRDSKFTFAKDCNNRKWNGNDEFSSQNHDFSCSLAYEIFTPETKLKKLKMKDQTLIDDMRYLSCSSFLIFNDVLCSVCACSDGIVRVYAFTSSHMDLLTVFSCDYHCALSVKTCVWTLGEVNITFVIGSSTKGIVYVWNITSFLESYTRQYRNTMNGYPQNGYQECESYLIDEGGLEGGNMKRNSGRNSSEHVNQKRYSFHDHNVPLYDHSGTCLRIPAHQSGVNSLDILESSDDGFLLITGGDDNQLSLINLRYNSTEQQLEFDFKVAHESAHISSITAVQFLNQSIVVSASIDQRIKFWSIRDCTFALVYELLSDIADVSNMEVWSSGDMVFVAVVGIGMEVFQIEMEKIVK